MTTQERVNAFLNVRRPSRFCDDCITESLELSQRHTAQKATSTLGATDNFHRGQGICSMCGKEKMVIQRT